LTTLLRRGAEDHVLLLKMHHIVHDGWSHEVLFGELAALYEAFGAGHPSPLPELPIQYADYAVWQREWLQGEVLDSLLDYWRRQLDGAPDRLALPTDRPRPAVESFRGGCESVQLPADLVAALEGLGRPEGATLFMTTLAAFLVLLYRYSGQSDLVVGTPF